MAVTLKPRQYRFPLKRLFGVSRLRYPLAKAFLLPQRAHTLNMNGTSEVGRQRAKAVRVVLREDLGREPTPREYRAAKKAMRVLEASDD